MGRSGGGGTSPRDTQLRRSAHTSIGGRTTSALEQRDRDVERDDLPKSRSSGNDDVAITATPEIAVSADTMNARPVRDAATSIASRGCGPAPAFLDEAQQDQRRELGAGGDDERTADRGHRAQLEVERVGEQRRRAPTAISTGTSDSSARTTLRSRNVRKRNTNRIAR